MRKIYRKCLSVAILITMILSSSSLINTIVYATTTTYQASSAFNNGIGIQGKDQWYYQQFNGTSYSNLTWDNANQKWQGSQANLVVNAYIMHPEVNYDAIRKWVAPCDGSARIYGNVRKYDTSGGNGVLVTIKQNSTNVWSTNIAYNDSVGVNYDFTESVKAGDAIYFSVNNYAGNIYNDSTYWDPLIDFTPLADGTSISEWNYTSSVEGWAANNHTTVAASGGILNVSVTGTDPSIISPDNLNTDITKSSILKIRYKNNTNDTCGIIYFTTNDDTVFTSIKAKCFLINANDPNYTEYTIDMSGVYGWVGKLKQIRLDPSEGSSGSYNIDYIKLQAGGANAPSFSLLDKEVVYNKSTLTSKGLNYYNDSNIGVIRNSDATYKFISSNGGGAVQCSTITSGTLDAPANTVNSNRLTIANTPSIYTYVSGGPVYQDPTDANTILTFVHCERNFVINSVTYFDANLGIAISRNGGSTWTWCGSIIDHDIAYDPTRAKSMDIGGGSYLIYNDGGTDYFYVYTLDFSESNPDPAGLAVSRCSVSSVLTAAKNNTVTSWYKYYNGDWTQPAINGSFTSLCSNNIYMGFNSISYNSYLNKYLLAYTSVKNWGSSNYADISLLVASSPIDFVNNTKDYFIDASSKFTQYPTIMGLGNSNPETQSQKNFYIYYMQWDNDQYWSSDTNMVRKMVVLD